MGLDGVFYQIKKAIVSKRKNHYSKWKLKVGRDKRSPTQPTKVFHQLDRRSAVSNHEASLIRKIIHNYIEATIKATFMRI